MSVHNSDHDEAAGDNEQERYAELVVGDDEFVIYDRKNHQAWLQSSESVSLDRQC